MADVDRAQLDALLSQLLDGARPEDFDANALGRKGAYRSERKASLAAAVLFEAAARRAIDAGQRTAWLEWLVRAGTHYFEAGQPSRALPMLREGIDAHLAQPGHRDAHMVEHAYTMLLQHALRAGDAEAFRATFAESVASCAKIGRPGFPSVHPHQELLLEAAHTLGCVAERDVVAQNLARRRPLSRALRARLLELGYAPPPPRASRTTPKG